MSVVCWVLVVAVVLAVALEIEILIDNKNDRDEP